MFDAIVRGYQGMGMGSGFGAVVVEVDADWRPCRDIAEGLKDQRVRVGLDDMGLMPTFEVVNDEL